MNRRTALVTGAAGFIGRHMVDELRYRNWDVDEVDLRAEHPLDALEVFAGDPTIYDLVVHCAAKEPHRAAIDRHPDAFPYNVGLDAALFQWAIRTRQHRVLYFSSCAALDGPDNYGWTKLTGERMAKAARQAGVKVTIVRPYSGYGEDQSEDFPFGAFVARAQRHEDPFPIWNPDAIRDWIHVDDVVRAALAVADSQIDLAVSLCTGVGTSTGRLAMMIAREAGYEPTLLHQKGAPAGVSYRVGEPALMRQFYVPRIDLDEGIRRALK